MPEKWEVIYRRCFLTLLWSVYILVACYVAVSLWKSLLYGGWRPRAAVAFAILYIVTNRILVQRKWFAALMDRYESGFLGHLLLITLLYGVPWATLVFLLPMHGRIAQIISVCVIVPLMAAISWSGRNGESAGRDS